MSGASAVVLMPSLIRARKQALTVYCGSNLHQIDVAFRTGEIPRGRSPDAASWISVVLTSTKGDSRVLYCPEDDAAGSSTVTGGFSVLCWNATPSDANPNGGQVIPLDHPWKVTRQDISPDKYILSFNAPPKANPQDLVIECTRDSLASGGSTTGISQAWIGKVLSNSNGYRFDVIFGASNVGRLRNVQAGQTFQYWPTTTKVSYGYNLQASNLGSKRRPDKIIAMDYKCTVIDFGNL